MFLSVLLKKHSKMKVNKIQNYNLELILLIIIFIQLFWTVVLGILKIVWILYLTFRTLWPATTIYFTLNLFHPKYKPFISLPDSTNKFLQHCKRESCLNYLSSSPKTGALFVPSFESKNVILGLLWRTQNILNQFNVLRKNSGLIFNFKNFYRCLIHSFYSQMQIKYVKYSIATWRKKSY